MPTSRTYRIRGLDCAEEAGALKAAVGRIPGVENLEINLLKGTMRVTCTDAGPSDVEIRRAVETTGLKVEADGPSPGGPPALMNTIWSRHGRGLMCAASGVFTLLGFLAHGFSHGGILHALTAGGELERHEYPPLTVALFAAAVVCGGWFVGPKAWAALRRRRPDMNLLMTVAVLGAAAIGEWFEAAAVAFLFSLSLVLESWSVSRARRAIESLLTLTPPKARYIRGGDGEIVEGAVEDVPVGSTVLVRPGERVPLDGFVVKGETALNQAPITGESLPVSKTVGDEVFAGTINETGAFEFRAAKSAGDTTLARIIRMVEEAQARRAPAEQWVDRFAFYYTPAMMFFALGVALLPPLMTGGHWGKWFYEALVILVIACPCALVISTPVAIVAGLTRAARAGVLIKGGAFLEAAARIRVVALDKTGTLTHGRPEVQRIVPLDQHTEQELLATAAGLEGESEHPLARAILRRARKEGVSPAKVERFQAVKGKGAEGWIGGRRFWIGSHRFAHENIHESADAHRKAEALEDAGHSVVAIGNAEHVCGLVSVADTLRPEARQAVLGMRAAGVRRIVMLTGDNEGTAKAVADEVGVDEFRAELLPEDKLDIVQELARSDGHVAVVGDGINDAPALAAATVGIAMGAAGTDAAIETADVALMSDDISKVPWLFKHGRRTMSIIRQNVIFALSIKAVFLFLALAGVATLWMAIAADMGASLLVIFNALRLLR